MEICICNCIDRATQSVRSCSYKVLKNDEQTNGATAFDTGNLSWSPELVDIGRHLLKIALNPLHKPAVEELKNEPKYVGGTKRKSRNIPTYTAEDDDLVMVIYYN